MRFHEKYTTKEKKAKEPEKERDKTELGTDAYAVAELLESLYFKIEQIRRKL